MSNDQKIIEPGGFLHFVIFWLKNPENESDRQAFKSHLTRFIEKSQYVKSKFIGSAEDSDRDVVDGSYTFCLALSFSSQADQDRYQDEPVHLEFIQNAQHLWEKVVVYDANNLL